MEGLHEGGGATEGWGGEVADQYMVRHVWSWVRMTDNPKKKKFKIIYFFLLPPPPKCLHLVLFPFTMLWWFLQPSCLLPGGQEMRSCVMLVFIYYWTPLVLPTCFSRYSQLTGRLKYRTVSGLPRHPSPSRPHPPACWPGTCPPVFILPQPPLQLFLDWWVRAGRPVGEPQRGPLSACAVCSWRLALRRSWYCHCITAASTNHISCPLLVLHIIFFLFFLNGAVSFLEGGRAGNGVVHFPQICFYRRRKDCWSWSGLVGFWFCLFQKLKRLIWPPLNKPLSLVFLEKFGLITVQRSI